MEGDDYLRGFEESIFCLAATGDGWGVRLKLAVLFRCIPVIIADQIQVNLADMHTSCSDIDKPHTAAIPQYYEDI